jgi:hypothetical protein
MINVDRIYQRVLTLANKEQRGYITPQEFNIFANQAQMDIFEQYFYDLNQFLRTPGNSTTHADMVDILEEKISVFEQTALIILNLSGEGQLSSLGNFYRLTSIRDGNIIYESISRKEARLFQLSPLARPTNTRPAYLVNGVNNDFELFGRIPDVGGAVSVDYIRIPLKVNWTYVVVGERALYNANANDAQNFELHPSEETELVLKILTLAGFTLKDAALYQAAAGEDMKSTQQEKQ